MTFDDLAGHSHVAGLIQFDEHVCDISHGFNRQARRAITRRQLSFLFMESRLFRSQSTDCPLDTLSMSHERYVCLAL